jgi:hypothetical protein
MCEYGLVLKCVDADKNVYQRKGVYVETHSKKNRIEPELVHQLDLARESGNEHNIRRAQEDCEVFESKDEKRIQRLMVDRYSFFDEDIPMIDVEII